MQVSQMIPVDPFSDRPIEPDEGDMLVNRARERAIVDELVQGAGRGYPQNLAFVGDDGMGKTSMLNYLTARCRMTSGLLSVPIDLTERTTDMDVIKHLIQGLLDQVQLGLAGFVQGVLRWPERERLKRIEKRLQGIETSRSRTSQLKDSFINIVAISEQLNEKTPPPQDLMAVAGLLKELVQSLGRETKAILVVVDEAEYISSETSANLLQRLRVLFQRRPWMLCLSGSGALFEKLSATEGSFVNLFPEHQRLLLAALSLQHVAELVAKRLSPVRIGGSGAEPFTAAALTALHEASRGNPRYVVRIAGLSLRLARDASAVESAHVREAAAQIQFHLGRDRFARQPPDLQELLILIARYPAAMAKELAEVAGLSPAQTGRKLQRLADQGYLTIIPHGRRNEIRLAAPLFAYCRSLVE